MNTSSTGPPTTTTVLVTATSTPPSTRATSPPTTARRATTTAPRAASSTSTTPPASSSCTPAQIAVTVDTDRATYGPGQEVKITSTLRNRSPSSCLYNGYVFGSAFRNAAGDTFPGVSVIADSFADVPLRPGETISHSASWDHRLCPEPGCGPMPPGPYTAIVTWNFASSAYELTTAFMLG